MKNVPVTPQGGSVPTLLILDDEPDELVWVKEILEPLKARLITVGTSEEAFRALESRDITLFLTDYRLCDESSNRTGLDVVREATNRFGSMMPPVIVMSGSTIRTVGDDSLYRSGVVDFLSKACPENEFRAKVEVILEYAHRMRQRERTHREREAALTHKNLLIARQTQELRSPLNAIMSDLQVMQNRQDLPTELRDQVESMVAASEELFLSVRKLSVVISRDGNPVTYHPRAFDLRALLADLEEVYSDVVAENAVQWASDIQVGSPCIVSGDRDLLSQVLVQLLEDAIGHSEGGAIHLRVKESQDTLYFEVINAKAGAQLPGNAEGLEKWSAHKFVRSESGSLFHLSLTLADRLLQLMGSELVVDTGGSRGSRFAFQLNMPRTPLGDGEDDGAEEYITDPVLADGQLLRIILMGRPDHGIQALSTLFRMAGASVRLITEFDGLVEEFSHEPVDAILFDLDEEIPAKLEAFRALDRHFPDSRPYCMALSTRTFVLERHRRLHELSFDDYLEKPFRFPELFSIMARKLGLDVIPSESIVLQRGEHNFTSVEVPREMYEALQQALRKNQLRQIDQLLEEFAQLKATTPEMMDRLRVLRERLALKELGKTISRFFRTGSDD